MKIFNKVLIIIFLNYIFFTSNITYCNDQTKKQNVNFIILAGGKGSRMGGNIPKVLKKIGNETSLERIINTCNNFNKNNKYNVTILPVISEEMKNNFNDLLKDHPNNHYIIEKERKGTAGAVNLALDYINSNQNIKEDSNISYILIGDAPTINPTILQKMKDCLQKFDVCTLGFIDKNKNNFGKMILDRFDDNKKYKYGEIFKLNKIKEAKDYNPEEEQPIVCNSGFHLHKTKNLNKFIKDIKVWEKTGELNINDIIEVYFKNNIKVGMVLVNKNDVFGANTPEEFEKLEKILSNKNNNYKNLKR